MYLYKQLIISADTTLNIFLVKILKILLAGFKAEGSYI